jgi:hypothetical protein
MTTTETVEKKKDFSSVTYAEACTGGGQFIDFTCRSEDVDRIKEVLKDVESISIPETCRVNVAHGSYGRYTRYDVKQHKYAGGSSESGGGGYIEVLEIKNPPDKRFGFIIHQYSTSMGSMFTEWNSIENAKASFEYSMYNYDAKEFLGKKGFVRMVKCGYLQPWFYAVGNQALVGDYAVVNNHHDDPVFRLGKKFIVYDKYDGDALPTIKTCLGTSVFEEEIGDGYGRKSGISIKRIVHWDDGTVWSDDFRNSYKVPLALEKDEAWIEEAIIEFKKLLIGRKTKFSINFLDGNAFCGSLKTLKEKKFSPEGRYTISAHTKLNNKQEVQEGWVDFTPTDNYPNIIEYVTKGLEKKGYKVISVEIKKKEVERGGKKWSGVFFRM